jgi:hypothetical protein
LGGTPEGARLLVVQAAEQGSQLGPPGHSGFPVQVLHVFGDRVLGHPEPSG